MQLKLIGLAALLMVATSAANAQTPNIPRECAKCDWMWDLYTHERDFWMLNGCNKAVQASRSDGDKYLDLDMSDILLSRYSGLPFYRFEAIDVATADCRQIMKPAIQWIWDVYMNSCVHELPASCRQVYPRP